MVTVMNMPKLAKKSFQKTVIAAKAQRQTLKARRKLN